MKAPYIAKITCLLFAITFANAMVATAASTITNIARGCTANHSLALESDGSLWEMVTTGGVYYADVIPQIHEIISGDVTAMAVNRFDSLFVKSDGSLWGMGGNFDGDLGIPTWTDSFANQPDEIVTNDVTAVAMGFGHSLFLKSDGSLWAMGLNDAGQLGNGTSSPAPQTSYGLNPPEEIMTNNVIAIAGGGYHSLFLKSDGSLWAMGWNAWGELGDGTGNQFTNQPEEIVASNVTAIAAGYYHSLFIKSDGSLWAMGDNSFGQLGDGIYKEYDPFTNQPEEIVASNVTAIAAGCYHSLFIKSDGSLWAMGDNSFGQLGDGIYKEYNPSTNQPEEIVASNVSAIAAGENHSLFIKSDGSLWGMGDNTAGQLGDGFWEDSDNEAIVPEQILPKPRPVLMQTVSNSDLQFTATCGFGGNFYLLTATNIAQPLCQWTPIWTNNISYRDLNVFSATLTNAVNSSLQQFYILQSP